MLGQTVSTAIGNDPTTQSPRAASVKEGEGVIYDTVAKWVMDTTGSFVAIKENAANKNVGKSYVSGPITRDLAGDKDTDKWTFILYEDSVNNEYAFRVVLTTTSPMTGSNGSWTAWNEADASVAIPEPTSGLLLLLGVAGLALKRKRA